MHKHVPLFFSCAIQGQNGIAVISYKIRNYIYVLCVSVHDRKKLAEFRVKRVETDRGIFFCHQFTVALLLLLTGNPALSS